MIGGLTCHFLTVANFLLLQLGTRKGAIYAQVFCLWRIGSGFLLARQRFYAYSKFFKTKSKDLRLRSEKKWCRLGDLNTRPHHYE